MQFVMVIVTKSYLKQNDLKLKLQIEQLVQGNANLK